MKNLLTMLADSEEQQAEHTFGCRKPNTAFGSWDGAFVYEKAGGKHMTSTYVDGEDYIGMPDDLKEAVRNYNFFSKRKGWVPMTPEDIAETSGAKITKETILTVPELPWSSWILNETFGRLCHRCVLPV